MSSHRLVPRPAVVLLFSCTAVPLAALFIVLHPLVLPVAAVPEAPGSIAGRVTDRAGAPLAGIQVQLYDYIFQTVQRTITTGVDGHYAFLLLNGGTYRIGYADPQGRYAPRYYPDAGTQAEAGGLTVAGNAVTAEDVALEPAAVLVGRIAITGEMRVMNYAPYFYRRDGDGDGWQTTQGELVQVPVTATYPLTFRITSLISGTYRLCFYAQITTTWQSQAPAVACDGRGVDMETAQDIVLHAGAVVTTGVTLGDDPADAIAGTVYDGAGRLAPHVPVWLWERQFGGYTWYEGSVEGQSDDQGFYRFLAPRSDPLSRQPLAYIVQARPAGVLAGAMPPPSRPMSSRRSRRPCCSSTAIPARCSRPTSTCSRARTSRARSTPVDGPA